MSINSILQAYQQLYSIDDLLYRDRRFNDKHYLPYTLDGKEYLSKVVFRYFGLQSERVLIIKIYHPILDWNDCYELYRLAARLEMEMIVEENMATFSKDSHKIIIIEFVRQ